MGLIASDVDRSIAGGDEPASTRNQVIAVPNRDTASRTTRAFDRAKRLRDQPRSPAPAAAGVTRQRARNQTITSNGTARPNAKRARNFLSSSACSLLNRTNGTSSDPGQEIASARGNIEDQLPNLKFRRSTRPVNWRDQLPSSFRSHAFARYGTAQAAKIPSMRRSPMKCSQVQELPQLVPSARARPRPDRVRRREE